MSDLLKRLCKEWDIAYEAHCRYCKQIHQAQSYKILNSQDPSDLEEVEPEFRGPSVMVDYGRCAAMTDPKQCFKTWTKASKEGRAALRFLAQSLGGKP